MLEVEKDVVGTATAGFVVRVSCTPADDVLSTVVTVDEADLPFTKDGEPDASDPPAGWVVADGAWQLEDEALAASTCTATELDTGGATTVSYACEYTEGVTNGSGAADLVEPGCPGPTSGPSATPAAVTFYGDGDSGVLTVTNTFEEEPPAPVEIQPTFTG